MNKQTFLLLASLMMLVMLSFKTQAQQKVGLLFDAGGQPIHGYIDPISYSPTVSISKDLGNYMPSIFYYKDGASKKRLMKFEDAKLVMKNETGSEVVLSEDTFSGAKVGLDSFFVAQNIHFRGRTRERPTFVQFIAKLDSTTFAKIYNNNYDKSILHQTYIAKKSGEERWEEINPQKESIDAMIKKCFVDYDNVIAASESIEHKKVNFYTNMIGRYEINYKENEGNIGALINLALVTNRHFYKKKEYYDQYFRKTKTAESFKYYSLITALNDRSYTEEYYSLDDQKVYSIEWSTKKNGEKQGPSSFFIDGELVMKMLYDRDKMKSGKVYHEGQLLYKYDLREDRMNNTTECYFNFMDDDRLAEWKDYMDVLDNTKKRIRNENLLVKEVYTKHKGKEYSNITDPKNPLKVAKLNKLFDKYIDDSFLSDKPILRPILVQVWTDKMGIIREYKILNKTNTDFDKKVNSFVKEQLLNGGKKGKLKMSYADSKPMKKPTTFVLPFKLNINGQYWFFSNQNDLMRHQMWMHQHNMQMMHLNSIHPPR
ncbi:hypothetical protein [Flammeovirga sp. EKP202]|uniref:hypothetical protein n=1 Tax=Flammeovirga sp. EKP202 TaxID=2770592 RepID=UPI00165F2392|nr:hypothetical protein [Flammeovirga sp. EKP202]MBD0402912.1 hypothetical protein [Flammeovirga sp. EKP202]